MMSRNLIFLSISFLSVRIENYRDLQDKHNDSACFADIIALGNKMINWPLQLQVLVLLMSENFQFGTRKYMEPKILDHLSPSPYYNLIVLSSPSKQELKNGLWYNHGPSYN